MENKDKIDFDLNFLDENTKEKPKQPPKQKSGNSKDPNWVYHKGNPGSKTPDSDSGGMSDSAKKWAWGIGIVLLFIVIGAFSDDSGSSSNSSSSGSTYTPTASNDTFAGGTGEMFNCYGSNYDRAMQLKPSSSTDAQLNLELDRLNAQIESNKSEGEEIESMYVDEYDQYAIDRYNDRVDDYNTERERLLSASKSWDQRSTAHQNQIDAYNNYLDVNCTPQ